MIFQKVYKKTCFEIDTKVSSKKCPVFHEMFSNNFVQDFTLNLKTTWCGVKTKQTTKENLNYHR